MVERCLNEFNNLIIKAMKGFLLTIFIVLFALTGWSKKNKLPLIGDKAP